MAEGEKFFFFTFFLARFETFFPPGLMKQTIIRNYEDSYACNDFYRIL